MIQRIQTIFLLGVVILSAVLLKLPVYMIQPAASANSPEVAPEIHSVLLSSNALLLIVNCAIGVVAFVTIFLYKNRNLQIRLGNLGILLTCALIGLLIFSADSISSGTNQVVHYSFGEYLPMVELLLFFLAVRKIKKDEELVRSADRLR